MVNRVSEANIFSFNLASLVTGVLEPPFVASKNSPKVTQLDGNISFTSSIEISLNQTFNSSSFLSLPSLISNSSYSTEMSEESWFSQCQNEEDPCSIPVQISSQPE